MSDKLISIIIPVYNNEKYIDTCLQSVCNQTFKNLEIIVINDGSTDSSLKVINRYSENDSRILVINQENQGVSSARNSGLDIAKGDYILFLDGDDWIENNCCEASLHEAEEYGVEVVFWSYVREYDGQSKPVLLFDNIAINWDSQNIKKLYKKMIGFTGEDLKQPQKIDALITGWGKLYKRSLVGNNRFIDTKIIGTEDALFNIQVFSNVKTARYLPETMYHYRKTNLNSLTHFYKKNLVNQWMELYKRIELQLNDSHAGEEDYHALSNRVCLGLIGLGLNLAEDTFMSFAEKQKELKKILSLPHYQKALTELEVEYLPIKWRLFFELAKKQHVILLYSLLCVMNHLRGR